MQLYIMCSRTFVDLVEAVVYYLVEAAVGEVAAGEVVAEEVVEVVGNNWPMQRYSSYCYPSHCCHSMKAAFDFVVERTAAAAAVAILAVRIDAAASASSFGVESEHTAFVAIAVVVVVAGGAVDDKA